MDEYYVYILRCSDGSYYTGVTSDLETRIAQHHAGMFPACYTYKRRPLKLVLLEEFPSPYDAIAREKQVKRWSRRKKEALVQGREKALLAYARCQNETHCSYYSLLPIAHTKIRIYHVMVSGAEP
ncbi:hypothetical protein A2454_07060 [Candidatus Peribacteria bacterium RIFOXYC2_FULL_55_14]|nr:MAG: hypothetical protein A2217_04310 [Candidatus Peribacteria bacterium RIFOXYA2_FULL_55_28]OGJ74763.1 MAG: hypothetical protein A2384_06940 [Candidatus Peribacteria bacterium RIFOXYB1_FULL_54_35]OGJ76919.1 MAG: hypothetical protein A2327_06455 [Candidatus Peribacteria bacterium RIFOXYB2_FULL_54_17]OGJ77878.1 MAG: hypothetical protein A2424_04685 [Candidatus Peribacteria bacterium RIFOXYC1_FULL_54_13]OGJ80170.1 MAG: hypothetical protein A2454_07060 [Candidatus Peribacteria bacterium RIFOXYC